MVRGPVKMASQKLRLDESNVVVTIILRFAFVSSFDTISPLGFFLLCESPHRRKLMKKFSIFQAKRVEKFVNFPFRSSLARCPWSGERIQNEQNFLPSPRHHHLNIMKWRQQHTLFHFCRHEAARNVLISRLLRRKIYFILSIKHRPESFAREKKDDNGARVSEWVSRQIRRSEADREKKERVRWWK